MTEAEKKQIAELKDIALNARIILTSPASKPGRKLIVQDLLNRIDVALNMGQKS
jgi:hypothetical protein